MNSREDRPILIVDDHPLFRDALKMAVQTTSPDRMVLEAPTLSRALELMAGGPVSLILLDLHLEDSDGFKGLLSLRQDYPATPILLCSASENADVIRRGIDYGAAGFVPKSAPLPTICDAIRAVLDGDIWVPESVDLSAVTQAGDDVSNRIRSLTPAQRRVLEGVVDGRLNKQIAFDMGISEATVKAHMTAIFRKLGVFNRTQVVLLAQHLVVTDPARSPVH